MADDDGTGTPGLTLADEKGGALVLALGFFLFGMTAGAITGASSAEGISNSLLGSLFTFVGGTVLGFAGFRLRNKGADLAVSGRRVGGSTAAFSLGVLVGLAGGIGARWHIEQHARELARDERPVKNNDDGGEAPGRFFVVLHGSDVKAIDDIEHRLALSGYSGEEGCKEAIGRLKWMVDRVHGK
jgi:hypothetical protein